MKKIFPLVMAAWTGLLAAALGGCNGNAGPTRGPGGGKEEWTIRCTRIETPDHKAQARFFADLLGRVSGLKSAQVRVDSDARGSTIFYGRYEKKAAPGGELVFPQQYQKDIELIRSLAYRDQTPFFFAGPELLSSGGPAGAEGDAATAKGSYTLLIAIFYNTETFTERKQVAEQYAQDLRKRGYPAYFFHEPARSMVYVGDFDKTDLPLNPNQAYGPRVQQLIDRNPDEFKIQTENGHIMARTGPDGQPFRPPSVLVPVPGRGTTAEEMPPAQPSRGQRGE